MNGVVTEFHSGIDANFIGFVVFVVVVALANVCTFLVDTFSISTDSQCFALVDINTLVCSSESSISKRTQTSEMSDHVSAQHTAVATVICVITQTLVNIFAHVSIISQFETFWTVTMEATRRIDTSESATVELF